MDSMHHALDSTSASELLLFVCVRVLVHCYIVCLFVSLFVCLFLCLFVLLVCSVLFCCYVVHDSTRFVFNSTHCSHYTYPTCIYVVVEVEVVISHKS